MSYILLDVDRMAKDMAIKQLEDFCVFNPYVEIHGERKLVKFWQDVVDLKAKKHKERLINLYGKDEKESTPDNGECIREGERV